MAIGPKFLAVFRRPLPVFAAASLLAVGVGAVVCARSGVPASLWGRNLAAWMVGGLAAAALGRWAGRRIFDAVALLTPLAMAASLLSRGQEGVHRWLVAGPLQVNAAMLLLPAFVVVLAAGAGRRVWGWIAAGITLALLVLQPDASQATALALALSVAAIAGSEPTRRWRWGIVLAALALAAVAWMRPDPLAPVPEVEGIVGLAWSLSPVVAALAVLAIAAFAAVPVLATRTDATDQVRRACLALTVLLLAWGLAPALGAFPVPLVGVGLSPILGAWLGVGLLAAAKR